MASTATASDTAWSLVIPVKVLARAKSRLAQMTGPYREQLALAVASDTVAATIRSPLVHQVVVVTDDDRAARTLGALGARVVADEPDAGLNPALCHGARVARAFAPSHGVCALSGDLPALRAEELTRALEAAGGHRNACVPDAAGSGTTLYTAAPGAEFRPAFGPDSKRRHVTSGVHELPLEGTPGLRRDVDTPADLADALRLGVGPQTARVADLLDVNSLAP